MRDAHGGIRGVNALAARTGGAIGIDTKIGLIDLDIDLVGLGQHGDSRRRSLDATLALGLGDALDAMHAGLILHNGVHAVARYLELDGLEAASLGRAGIEHFHLPTARLDKALVHLKEVAREDGCFVAAGSGANLDDGVFVVVGVAGDEHELDVFLKLRKLCLVLGDVHLEHLFLIGIGRLVQHLLGGLDVVECSQVLAGGAHKIGLMRVLLVETRKFFDVGGNRGVCQLLFELFVGSDELLEFVAHVRLLYSVMGK